MSDVYDSDLGILHEMGMSVPASRFIQIDGEGLGYNILDMGVSAVCKIYDMAKENKVPYAESVDVSYCANCDVFFRGDNLYASSKNFIPTDSPTMNRI